MPRSPSLLIKDPLIWVMLALFVVCNICVIWIFVTIYERIDLKDLRSQTFAIRLMQVTLGMVIGLATTFLGVIVAWFGVTESVDLEVNGQAAKGRFAAAGPGALLVLCGTALIYVCIQKEFKIYDAKPINQVEDISLDQKHPMLPIANSTTPCHVAAPQLTVRAIGATVT